LDNPKFAISLEQDPETEIPLEEAFQELGLVLLPRAKALWESWFESGLLRVEEGEDGRYWIASDTPSQADVGN
jgi:hypothetical protein